jgi:hypothetical protein
VKTDKLDLPFGVIQVLLNDEPTEFEYNETTYNKYWSDDEKEIQVQSALSALNISLNTKDYNAGDMIYIYCNAGKLIPGCGDVDTVNAIAQLDDFTYGIGGPDTESMEWAAGNIPGSTPDAGRYGYTHRSLSYELACITKNGIKYRIVKRSDDVEHFDDELVVNVAWESNAEPDAYSIVSLLTY